MRLVRTLKELDEALEGRRSAFVPTMGALHTGHQALIRRAAQLAKPEGLPVVVSIFVNPTQFGPSEDFEKYPRRVDADAAAASEAGAEIVFAPDIAAIYPPGKIAPAPPLPAIATQPQLEDAVRPMHFAGVCQVVARLFDLVHPAIAILGEKDYQQLRVIEAMVEQEGRRWPGLRVVPHPTLREPDGLAMSSRNAYLKPSQRDRALGLFRALRAGQTADDVPQAERMMREVLQEHELRIDYAVVRDANTLMPPEPGSKLRGLIAARLGEVRLIDNMALK